jgi:hypothetical protein
MRRFLLPALAACLFLASSALSRAGDSPVFQVIATADSTDVHPEALFDVTLSLKNLTASVQRIKVPYCGWDRLWKSSNHRVEWDAFDCDQDTSSTVEIPPHETYVFPKALGMYVDDSVTLPRIDFKMGYRPAAFGKTLWSAPITLNVIP